MRCFALLMLLAGCSCGGTTGRPDATAVPPLPANPEATELAGWAIEHTARVTQVCGDDRTKPDAVPEYIGSAVYLRTNRVATAAHVVDDPVTCDYYVGGKPLDIDSFNPEADTATGYVSDGPVVDPVTARRPLMGEDILVVGWPVDPSGAKERLYTTGGTVAGQHSQQYWRITAPMWFGNSGGGCWAADGSLLGLASQLYRGYDGWYFMVLPPNG